MKHRFCGSSRIDPITGTRRIYNFVVPSGLGAPLGKMGFVVAWDGERWTKAAGDHYVKHVEHGGFNMVHDGW